MAMSILLTNTRQDGKNTQNRANLWANGPVTKKVAGSSPARKRGMDMEIRADPEGSFYIA